MTTAARKIAIIAPKLYPVLKHSDIDTFGGAEVALALVARELSRSADFDVHVLVGDYGQNEEQRMQGLILHRALNSDAGTLRNAAKLLKSLRRVDAQVYIQRTLTIASALIALYCRASRRKFVYWVAHDGETDGAHPLYKKITTSLLVDLMFRLSSRVIVQNKYEEEQLRERVSGIQCTLIKKGIPLPSDTAERQESIDAIWVGRCDEWKNPEAFIELAREQSDFRFLMICPAAQGKEEYHRKVMSRASDCTNLDVRGRTANHEVLELMRQSKVFCITSYQEGDWPNVVLEAASLRKPVLSLAINYDDLITKYEGGRFANSSFSIFADEFRRMMHDTERRKKMGSGAYNYVRETHNARDQNNKLTALLNGLFE
jgi:glycosyltransferase involved in cell wall biosynthesis